MRWRLRLMAAGVVVLAAAMMPLGARPALAAGTGPTIAVGTPSLVGGNVRIPVYAVGIVGDSYFGANMHMRWDPALFRLVGFTSAGAIWDQTRNPPTGFCASNSAKYDGDGGGIIVGCVSFAPTRTTGRLLGTFTLAPVAAGCSRLHLYTYGGADGGDTDTGTFTLNWTDILPQSNHLADGSTNQLGQTCTPP